MLWTSDNGRYVNQVQHDRAGFALMPINGRILLANLLQSSRSTFSRGSLLSFFAFKEGMLGTPISVLGGWPTVSGRLLN
jgi:hypothetical protein